MDGAYHHPALPFVLHTCFFKGKSPVSRVHRSSFPRYIEATNTEEEKLKITDAMLTFAAVIIWSRLKEIGNFRATTQENFSGENCTSEFESNLSYFKETIAVRAAQAGEDWSFQALVV